jgi:hypothetical protein
MELNAAIRDIPVPSRMAHRPISERGFPVPWFVSFLNGKWDFVNLDPRKVVEAYNRNICWLCGETLGQYKAFAIGPMCSINRVSSEPPAHLACAEYAVRACPFLARPNAKRNEAAHLAGDENVPGIMLQHNPGAVVIWVTKGFSPMKDAGGVLFKVGEPVELHWYAEGRKATRGEIEAAIEKGLPFLRRLAITEGNGAEEELDKQIATAKRLLPAE